MSKKKVFILFRKTIGMLLLIAIVLSLSCATGRRRRRHVRKRKGFGVYHIVQPKQTLWRIAKTYNVNLKTLKKANRLSDTTKIGVGQKIFIPGAKKVKRVSVVNYPVGSTKKAIKKVNYGKLKKPAFDWPLNGQLTSSFGMRKKRKHDGIDVAAPKGTNIKAAGAGKVIFSGWGPTGYGRVVILRHNERFITVYAHSSKNTVKKGQYVKKGQLIAKVGSTGRSTGPHLHFEVRVDKIPQNPLRYLP